LPTTCRLRRALHGWGDPHASKPSQAHRFSVAFCFEPDRNNFDFLQRNTAEFLPSGRVKLFNIALFDRDQELAFEISDWNFGDHRVGRADSKGAFGEQNRAVTSVPARRLDDIVDLTTLRLPRAVKIDTQGAEVNVLNGGRRVIAAAGLPSLEFCPCLVRRMGEHEQTLIEFIGKEFEAGCIGNWHAHQDGIRLAGAR
jgi:FkbM family methyltransferase